MLSFFKIYYTIGIREKGIILKKGLRLLSFIVSLSLGLNGCSIKQKNYDQPNLVNEIAIDYIDEEKEEVINQKEITCTLSQKEREDIVKNYVDYFSNIDYEYKGEEYYPSSQEIKSIIDDANSMMIAFHDEISLDTYETFLKIKQNSEKYISENPELSSCFFNNNGGNIEFFNSFEIALYHLLKEMPKNETNDIKEDFCRFQGLSICSGDVSKIIKYEETDDIVLGYYDYEKNLIVIDMNNIIFLHDYTSKLNKNDNYYASLIDIISCTLTHEFNHVRQHACNCRMEAGQKYSSIGDYNKYVSGLIEASAESSIYNVQNYLSNYFSMDNVNSYDDEREKESKILLLGLLSHDKDDYYNSIFDSDLNSLYEFTGCTSEEEINRLYHILYNMDAIMYRNELPFDITVNGNNISSNLVQVGNEYCYEVFNIFTGDLINYIYENEDFTCTQALALFSIAQSLCLNNNYSIEETDDTLKFNVDANLASKINKSRIKFERFIMKYYSINESELESCIIRANNIITSKDIEEKFIYSYEIIHNNYLEYQKLLDRFSLLEPIIESQNINSYHYQYVYKESGIDFTRH